LRERVKDCAICGIEPTITELQDYPRFCGTGPNDKVCFSIIFSYFILQIVPRRLLEPEERILPRDYELLRMDPSNRPILIDTRPPSEFEICNLNEAKSL
jgi:hypothetical protein